MPKSHPPYPPELRRRLVEMVRAGRSPAELGEQFEPSEQCIRNWVKQADRDDGKRQDGLTTAEKDELARLRREVRTLLHQLQQFVRNTAHRVSWYIEASVMTEARRSGTRRYSAAPCGLSGIETT